ncbi:MAG TPA: PrsW family glutamic-type intramembrane protease [Polyangiaceae bacterium]|nr:PrsW family glutamic-type intramembrane protease [Polyangiaceae bacterium]
MIAILRWLIPALVPVGCFALLLLRTDPRREPRALVFGTFALGLLTAALALVVTLRVEAWTGLDVRVAAVGQGSALTFIFLVVAPVQEVAKVAAAWPAFVSKHIDEPYDGVVHAAAASLAYAAVEIGWVLHANGTGSLWIARALLSLPAHVFFACLWGYALGRAKRSRRGPSIFPAAFIASIVAHGLYAHFVYGRGPGALLAVSPLLAAMGFVSWLLARDLETRDQPPSRIPSVQSRRSLRPPPSLATVRAALKADEEPVRLGWILFGAMVTLGAMVAGVAAGVFAAHAFHIDLSTVDEHDLAAASPALLVVIGLLLSFPASGWLITRAGGMHTLLEPALANVLALLITTVTLSIAAPFAVVFALALSPVAWVLSFIGAWVAREA